jgi:hypothetical protein
MRRGDEFAIVRWWILTLRQKAQILTERMRDDMIEIYRGRLK